MSSTSIETPHGRIIVRPTTSADAQQLRALRIEALTTSPTSFGSGVEDVDDHDWVKLATGDAEHQVFVAEHAGELVGLTGLYRPTRSKAHHHADVWGVYVRPAWRRLGLAQALLNAACD